MDSCCKRTYNCTFDSKTARQEMASYLKNGPKKSTRILIDPLKEQGFSNASLLDIGGGIGAVTLELLQHGVDQAYYQEISEAYAEVFGQQAIAGDQWERVHIQIGDFVDQHGSIPFVDIVIMDKVICCYQDYAILIELSLQKARRFYAYTIPLDVWWVKAVHAIGELAKKLIGNKIATFVHPVKLVENLVLDAGFDKIYERQSREWLVVIYKNKQVQL